MTTTYSVTADALQIQFGLTGVASVKQNIQLICTTMLGSCPLDRAFGIDLTAMDQSTTAAAALLQVNILSAIEQFEPRAIVTDISLQTDGEKVIPTIKFVLKEEVAG
ncbi:GPW/gp25 family protein [Paenibacillus phoenicis]|jgi:hypothetical protein|uniref:GPW/gp25 family protein n=1 Tax=Paenibacillus phoenicis TaxID=554117 RepID=UPI003D2D83DD